MMFSMLPQRLRVPFSNEPVTEPFIPPSLEDMDPKEFLDDRPVIPDTDIRSALYDSYNDYQRPATPAVSHEPVTTKKKATPPKNRPVIPTKQEMEWPSEEKTEWRTPTGESRRYALQMYRYRPRRNEWKHVSSQNRRPTIGGNTILPMTVRVITWNVTCDRRVWEDRITGVLRHLEDMTSNYRDSEQNNGHEGEACVIMLQEVTPEMLNQYIKKDKWVQSWFAIVPIEHEKWPKDAYFGNVTLVSRDLDVHSAEIVHYGSSRNQRTGLVVRIKMSLTGMEEDGQVIVFGNTHLESMAAGETLRPGQLRDMAHLLKEDDVEGGVIAGDMNAIDESDMELGRNLGLQDAYTGKDSDPEGFTCLPQENEHAPRRLDRIYYLPGRRYSVDEPMVFGVDLTVTTKEDEEHSLSDHCGLETLLHVTD